MRELLTVVVRAKDDDEDVILDFSSEVEDFSEAGDTGDLGAVLMRHGISLGPVEVLTLESFTLVSEVIEDDDGIEDEALREATWIVACEAAARPQLMAGLVEAFPRADFDFDESYFGDLPNTLRSSL